MPSTGRLLHHDPASKAYTAPVAPVPATSWLHSMGPVLDQGDVSGCTGWTGADFLNSALAGVNRKRYNTKSGRGFSAKYLTDADGKALYAAGTRNDEFPWTYPPTDNGGSGLGVAKALKAMGVIDAYDWTFSFDQMLAWGVRQPLMLGTLWTAPMMDPNSKGVIVVGSQKDLETAAADNQGHEYSLRGVNWPRKQARIRNHWTAEWGLKGEALISLDDLHRLIIGNEGDVCVPRIAVP